MKKLLLVVLAFGMFANAFAQPEVSDKWVITPVPTMKGVLGRLDINFPADVERNILIYQQADNKFLRSVSHNDKTYTIAPGEYRFTLTNVPVENVPIKKGHETRLKAGFLDIVSEGDWHLYDETKEKAYTSGNKPKKLPLPVGRYQIKLGGQFYPVVIKDGETVEDYTPVEIKDEIVAPIMKEMPGIIDAEKWVISPINSPLIELGEQEESSMDCEIPSLVHGIELEKSGSLNLDYPAFWSIIIRLQNLNIACGRNDWGVCSCPKSYPLLKGKYDLSFNRVSISGVPIMAKHETKLKTGKIKVLIDMPWGIYSLSKDTNYTFGINPGEVTFPVGTYSVFNNDRYETIELKQGQIIEVHPGPNIPDSKIDLPYLINPVPTKIKNDSGRINLAFDPSFPWSIVWTAPGFSDGVGNTYNNNVPPPSMNIAPGTYTFTLNKVKVPNVPILTNKETKLKVGYLLITTPNRPWEVRDRLAFNTLYAQSEGSLDKLVLPVGIYLFKLDPEYFFIRIENGKTLVR